MSIEAMKQALEALDCINSPLQVWEINKLAGAMNALRQAIEFAEMVEKGTKAWADTPDDWVDDLRGGAEIVPSDYPNSHRPVAWIKKDELAYMSAVAGLGMTVCLTNLGLRPQPGDVPLYTTCQENRQVAKSATTDWEAVAADQAMTIAMMKLEQKREWVEIPYVSQHDSPVEYNFTEAVAWAVGYNQAIDKLKEKNT
jgi:hypothetical protein